MAALDFSSLKAYVGGGAPRALSSGSVLLDVEHSLIAQRFVEIPFDVHWTVDEVKQKVYQLCGTQPDYQQLHLGGAQGPLLAPNTAPLSSFGVTGGPASSSPRLLYVRDVDPYALGRNGALHDVSQVQKYVMSDEEYGRRGNTYRAFKQKQREADPTWRSIYEKKAAPHKGGEEQREAVSAETEAELVSRIPLHCRCQVTPGERRGTVQYVGPVPELRVGSAATAVGSAATWVGVALDEPLGKNDGEVGGRRYFTCPAKRGVFLRPQNVQAGDFPELDPFDDDEEDEEDKTAAKDEGLYEEL